MLLARIELKRLLLGQLQKLTICISGYIELAPQLGPTRSYDASILVRASISPWNYVSSQNFEMSDGDER